HNPFSSGLPNVSVCFQHTILVWIPTAFFWVLLPFLFAQASLNGRRYKSLPWSLQLYLKMGNTTFITLVSLFIMDLSLILTIYGRNLEWFLLESYICRLFCLPFAADRNFIKMLDKAMTIPSYLSSALCISYLVWYAAVIIYVFVMCWADPRDSTEKARGSAELDSSFFNRLTLWWFNPVPWKGARKDLEPEDLFELNEGSTTKYLSELWEEHWHHRIADYYNKMRIWQDYGQLIGFVSDPKSPLWVGLSYSILMFAASEVRSFVLNSYFYIMFRMGIKFQTALTAAVYKKSLELSNSARRDKTVGEIVNLMAIDIERFQMITPQIQQFWSCPYQITLALAYLFLTLGYSALPGFIIMLIALPSNIICSIIVKKWQVELCSRSIHALSAFYNHSHCYHQVQQMKLKDERTKMVNEVLNGIKVVKLYAWELPMEELINEIRRKELVLLRKSFLVRNVMDSFNTASCSIFLWHICVVVTSHELTPQVAFVSLTLFNQLRSPMTMIAMLISQIVQVLVSNRRLKEYFVAEELDLSIVDREQRTGGSVVEFGDFSATWDEGSDSQRTTNTLQDINLEAKGGSFIAVVGQVGAGKSSLLSALLGEMGKLRGTVGLHGDVAYVPQQPWIQNMTLRDNILFGKPFDKRKYNQVLSACALKPDLKVLAHGDLTEIGEKGINLSGGQKARVSLARAVYQDHDIYLLDDPLSAVDAHVGRHIFEKVLGPDGLLRNKTRILVTHRLSYIKFADEIIVLQDGRIIENGRYSELMRQRGAFYKFVEEYKSSSESDENSEGSGDSDGLEKSADDIDTSKDLSDSEEKTSKSALTSSFMIKSSDGKLIKKEEVETGQVKLSVYRLYMKAGTYWKCFSFFFLLAAFQLFQTMRSFWLSAWSDDYDGQHAQKMATGWRLGIYGTLGTIESLCFLFSLVSLAFAGLAASYNLHAPLLHNLFRSPMSFYDTTPLGRILNRCAKDIEVVDMLLPTNFRYLAMCILQVFVTLIVIVISTPIFAVVILPLMIIYYFFLRFLRVPTSRQLRSLREN
ncbi:ABC transporter, ATP-binding protein, partial [Ostertagia ostertagi]